MNYYDVLDELDRLWEDDMGFFDDEPVIPASDVELPVNFDDDVPF